MQSNPLVPGGEGWEITRNWKIDTYGALWVPNRQYGYEGEWNKVDLTWWQEQFTRNDWKKPFVDQTGHQLHMIEEADGRCWLELRRSCYHTNEPDRRDKVRDGLLQATAAYIAEHTR